MLDQRRTFRQSFGLIVGPLAALVFLLGPAWGWSLDPERPELNAMAAITVLMALWWLTEAIPISATALLPLALAPLLKIAPARAVAAHYGDPMIFLFLGGFLIALAIEDSGLHRRVALWIISAMGDSPRRVVLGFMLATGGLSMWLSNTATTMMLLPIAASVLMQADREAADPERVKRFGVALMLGLAYSASIGGIATLIGTPPNVAFASIFARTYPDLPPISFFDWMTIGVPFSACMLITTWVMLTRVLFRIGNESFLGGRGVIREQLRALGPMSRAERRMAVIFAATAILWITRAPVPDVGWAYLLNLTDSTGKNLLADDGTVAMTMALLCFIVPSGNADGKPLLLWGSVVRLPWGILLLFGGGIALAGAMRSTGLDAYLGERLAGGMQNFSYVGMMLVTATGMTFLTELTTNLTSVNMILPVLAGTADQLGINPRLLMIPATLSASCAFMLPVATAPNAIVYGSGRVQMSDMVKAGIWLNLIGIAFVVACVMLLGD